MLKIETLVAQFELVNRTAYAKNIWIAKQRTVGY